MATGIWCTPVVRMKCSVLAGVVRMEKGRTPVVGKCNQHDAL